MRCKRYREKLSDALASGETMMSAEIAAHLEMCAECRDFYDAQRQLLAAIDEGVRVMVNQAMPAPLLPSVRARMEETAVRKFTWQPAWRVAAVAGVVLMIGFGALRHNWERNGPRVKPVGIPLLDSAALVTMPTASGTDQHVGRKKQIARRKATAANPKRYSGAAEVIVLPDEREAFARFVARLPEQKEAAASLARKTSQQEDAPLEIALLQIKELEVEPLESSEEQ